MCHQEDPVLCPDDFQGHPEVESGRDLTVSVYTQILSH